MVFDFAVLQADTELGETGVDTGGVPPPLPPYPMSGTDLGYVPTTTYSVSGTDVEALSL